jgi:hypothetical protein
MPWKHPVLNQASRHETVWESGGIAPHILNHGTRCRWVVSFTPGLSILGERSPGTGNHWVGVSWYRCWHSWCSVWFMALSVYLEMPNSIEWDKKSQDLWFTQRRKSTLWHSGLWRRVVLWKDTDVSEDLAAATSPHHYTVSQPRRPRNPQVSPWPGRDMNRIRWLCMFNYFVTVRTGSPSVLLWGRTWIPGTGSELPLLPLTSLIVSWSSLLTVPVCY